MLIEFIDRLGEQIRMNDTSREAQNGANNPEQGNPARETVDTTNTADAIHANEETTGQAKPETGPVSMPMSGPVSESVAPQNGEIDLEKQLAEAQAKATEYLDGWQRARAEFVNYRKRAEKERDESFQNASAETLRKILPIIDDFDRAVSNVPADKADDEVIKGFSLIHRKLLALLESSGIKVINPVGEKFDPAFHEAIGQDESSDVPGGHITVVLQKGYVHGDKVLRPALVRVAA
jgi:molecular chaperone GrpE